MHRNAGARSYDTVDVIADKIDGRWCVTSMVSTVDH
jgi:hypothetical protein